jgi:hypothetical protein
LKISARQIEDFSRINNRMPKQPPVKNILSSKQTSGAFSAPLNRALWFFASLGLA